MARKKKVAGEANAAGSAVTSTTYSAKRKNRRRSRRKMTATPLSRLKPTASTAFIHAEGEWLNGGGERRVAANVGPEVGNVAAMQVENTTHAERLRVLTEGRALA